MFSEMTLKLLENGKLLTAVWETVAMTLVSTGFGYLFGLPLGILLSVTAKGGLRPCPWLNRTVGFVVNIFRSVPFIILMVAFLPVAKAVVGTSFGNRAMTVMLVIAATPYIARMVESSLREVPAGVIEAAQSMGTPNLRIITRVLLPEAKPSLIVGAVISAVTVLSYSAMASTIGGGGLGMIAVTYGHERYNDDLIWISVVLTVLIVQIIQEVGMRLSRVTDKRIRK